MQVMRPNKVPNVLPGSALTCFGCGQIFDDDFKTVLLLMVKEF